MSITIEKITLWLPWNPPTLNKIPQALNTQGRGVTLYRDVERNHKVAHAPDKESIWNILQNKKIILIIWFEVYNRVISHKYSGAKRLI